ncbi:Tetrapyrrole-binding family protein [Salix suchowensis]|nr:Tetrapyrrole-binding family protein [Salix suchowensis]
MATNSLRSLSHRHSLLKFLPSDTLPPSSLLLKPATSISINTSTSLSLSISSSATTTAAHSISPATSTTPSTSKTSSLDLLRQHLSNQNFREADEETADFSFNNKFGYSVQKRIWQQKANKDFTKFFIKVGWMKKLDTEVEQHNYRAFPNEFIWELSDDTPEGHLPLTNALRGTQLLKNILNHPAFEVDVEDEVDDNGNGGPMGLRDSSKLPLSKRILKSDYSF